MAAGATAGTRRIVVTACIAAAALLSAFGVTDLVLDACGLSRLAGSNQRYLQSSLERSLKTFGVLSGVKVGLAIVEGTEVGVGFGLQVGDIVQATYDYVDIAWRTVLAGGVVLLGTRYFLEAVALLDQWLLVAALCAMLLMLLLRWNAGRPAGLAALMRDLSLVLAVAAVAAYLVVPVSVRGAAWLSTRITAPSLADAEAGLEELQRSVSTPSDSSRSGFFAPWVDARERLRAVADYLGGKATQVSLWVLKLVAAYVFDCIVFPLGLLVLLLYFTRTVARYLYGVRQSRSLRDDLDAILGRYFSRRRDDHGRAMRTPEAD